MQRLFRQEIVAFALGWVIACWLHPVPVAARAVACAGLLALLALRRVRQRFSAGAVVALGFLLCAAFAGIPTGSDGLASHLDDSKTDLLIRGTIVDGPRGGPEGSGYVLDATWIDEEVVSPTKLRLWTPHHDDTRAGDEVEVFARCSRFAPRSFPRLPGPTTRWSRRGFRGRCTVLEPFLILRRGSSLRGFLAKRRLQIEATLHTMDAPASGVAIAMLTGTRGFVTDGARDAFRDTGTGHLLAISGLHFGMLAGVVWLLAGLLLRRSSPVTRRWGARRTSALLVAGVMAAYLALVGAPTSASRAWVVVLFAAAGLLFFRRPSGFAALAAAALVLTIREPEMVRDLGFQLSFCATGAIVLFWWRRPRAVDFDRYLFDPSRRKILFRQIGAFVLMSWCATAVTWPLLLGATGRISLVAWFLNPLVVPWVGGIVFPVLLAATLIATAVPAANVLLRVPQVLIDGTLFTLEHVAASPYATWCPGVAPDGFVGFAVAVVLSVIAVRMRPLALLVGAISIGSMVAYLELHSPPPALRMHFIPVGQGDATLVEFPGGERVLFDAGGTRYGRDPGRWVVVPYLWRLGIARLDALVVTHDDVDHSGGVSGVLSEIAVDRVLRDPAPNTVPGVGLERLLEDGSKNDRSIVATIRQMGTTTLLTGDVERRAEAVWLRTAERVTVLKVPHHGSTTSSSADFLDAARPVLAVVSAGRHNRFGHPHPHVVDRYTARAIPLFSTAHHGLIVVAITPDGQLQVRSVR